ncbi:MAG TPA: hypothetical protein VK121_02535 [Pseudogracilibacillus sp.]|nr:hypothetical protein [Pseudogracilibacillus sp.]
MCEELFDFMEVDKTTHTTLDQMKEDLIFNMLNHMEKVLHVNFKDYDNMSQLIEEKIKLDEDVSYFWDWLEHYGYKRIKTILEHSLGNHEDLEAELEYRQFVLEMDIESNVLDNFFTSVADTVSMLYDLNDKNSEIAVTLNDEIFGKMDISQSYTFEIEDINNKEWHFKNPAGNQRGFCYN